MAITFPRALPLYGVTRQSFEPQRVDFMSPDARGRIGGITAGFPLWKAIYTLADDLTIDESDEWCAFMAAQRGQQRQFYGYEYGRTLPRTYPTALPGGFSGSFSSWSQTIDANGTALLGLNGGAAGLVLLPGDYVGFQWGTGNARKAMVRCIEGATANGSGNIGSVAVEPAVPSIVPGGATAYVNNPVCLMKMVASESSLGSKDWRGIIDGGQITAIQELIA